MSHYILDCDPGHDNAIALLVAAGAKVASDLRAEDIIELVLDTLADFP